MAPGQVVREVIGTKLSVTERFSRTRIAICNESLIYDGRNSNERAYLIEIKLIKFVVCGVLSACHDGWVSKKRCRGCHRSAINLKLIKKTHVRGRGWKRKEQKIWKSGKWVKIYGSLRRAVTRVLGRAVVVGCGMLDSSGADMALLSVADDDGYGDVVLRFMFLVVGRISLSRSLLFRVFFGRQWFD